MGGARAGSTGAAAAQASGDEPLLVSAKDGSGDLLFEGGGFSARIAPDGGVKFRDKRFSAINLLPWLPAPAPRNVPSVQSTVLGLLREHKTPFADERRPNDSSLLLIPLLTRHRPDPREGCRECNVPLGLFPGNATGRFDLTDEVMRLNSMDPYRYEKARFLVATREMRIAKAVKTHAENIRRATSELPGQLRKIACDHARSLNERRQIIERLRDDLDGATAEARSLAAGVTSFLESHFQSADGGAACPPPP